MEISTLKLKSSFLGQWDMAIEALRHVSSGSMKVTATFFHGGFWNHLVKSIEGSATFFFRGCFGNLFSWGFLEPFGQKHGGFHPNFFSRYLPSLFSWGFPPHSTQSRGDLKIVLVYYLTPPQIPGVFGPPFFVGVFGTTLLGPPPLWR